MLRKYGKFYADWTDPKGTRRRKAFPTKQGAEKFQTRQRLESAAKKAQPSGKSRPSARAGSRTTKPHASAPQPKRFAASQGS